MTNINYEILFFFIFSSLSLTSAFFVIYSKNSVYSIFFLILVFVNSTALLILSEIEFIAIMFIVIYVGAITILFIFIVMMVNIDKENETEKQNFGYLPIIFSISGLFLAETILMFSKTFGSYQFFIQKSYLKLSYYKLSMFWTRYPTSYGDLRYILTEYHLHVDQLTNVETLGQVLYTYYSLFFLLAGLILLIALIGAVSLTVITDQKRTLTNKKTNNIYKQISRNSTRAIYKIK